MGIKNAVRKAGWKSYEEFEKSVLEIHHRILRLPPCPKSQELYGKYLTWKEKGCLKESYDVLISLIEKRKV